MLIKLFKDLTLANDMQSQPMILGMAAIIRDCKLTKYRLKSSPWYTKEINNDMQLT